MLWIAFISVIILFGQDVTCTESRVCHFTSRTVDNVRILHVGDVGTGAIDGTEEKCLRPTYHCYALWREDSTGSVDYIAQGCWESSGKQDCDVGDCISKRKLLNNTSFCCCTGDYCNTNVTYVHTPDSDLDSDLSGRRELVEMVPPDRINLAVITIVLAFGIVTVGILLVAFRIIFSRRGGLGKPSQESVNLMEHGSHLFSSFNSDDLKLEAQIGQGRYGSVWKGTVGEMEVAVKIFPTHHRMYYYNERDIYTLPFMNHPSLLAFLGCDERLGSDGAPEFLLLLSLAPLGSMQSYLRSHTLDFTTFCKMALSVAQGLAHLHTDIAKGDKLKPCLSHRDLNSNNILVKDDLSCAICDLGFATQINGSKYFFNGEEQHAETKSITDVGTLRYMSPEVLEGAVNLRDCETSLKQIDVYALGLVLWELASRCTDFFPTGVENPSYKLPFEAEIGHPTLEQMQVLVCRHKARPLFPDLWRDTNAVRTVRETIEDCWDHDAEARLTALCVEERFHELSGFTERQRGTVYTTGVSPTGRGCSLIQKESHNVFGCDDKEGGGDSCQSEATTDTLLNITPTNPQINCKNSNQFYGFCPTLQPYQGRNPCLERNLMVDPESSLSELVDKSHKHHSIAQQTPGLNTADYLNIQTQHVSPPAPAPPRPTLPIPFLQNVSSEPPQPKMSNLSVGVPRRSTWVRIRMAFSGRRSEEALLGNESAVTVSTPMEDKLQTKVALSNGRPETKIADGALDLGTQNNRRPNTLQLSSSGTPSSREGSSEKNLRGAKTKSLIEPFGDSDTTRLILDPFGSQPRLKDPHSRVKTPGDVPLEVRRVRGQKNVARFSLYDDRIMTGYFDDENLASFPPKSSESEGLRSSMDDAQFSQNI